MPVFQYSGRNRRGESVQGRIEAANADAVATQLFNNGVIPINISTGTAGSEMLSGLNLRLREPKVELLDLIFFSRQMFTLMKAGVPIMQAMRGLRETTQNPSLAKVIGGLSDGLDAGLDLTSALKRHSEVFPPLFISMVQVGESTGSLPAAFSQLAQYLERERDTRERVKQAVRYPAFVVIAIVIAVVIINLFVIPSFAKVYENFHAELPWATKLLIAVSNFTVAYWYWFLGALIALIFGIRTYIHTPEGSYAWHRMKIRLPVVGSIIYRASLARFSRSLAATLKAGVPLVQGMTVVSRAVENDYIGERVIQMRDGIERGESITRTAAATGMFPPLVIQMVSVGEETGAVDDLMGEVADYYDREVDYDIKNLSASIEPILIVGIGAIVLLLALGVFLPMWDLASAIRSK